MNTQKHIFLFLFIIFYQTTYSQSIGGIDIQTIKMMVEDPQGVYFYPTLLDKFKKNDASLKVIDMKMLYYGFCFAQNYNPYKHFAWEDSLSILTEKQKGKEALALADKLLAENPLSLFGNIEKAIALNGLNRKAEAVPFLERYRVLMDVIESSGVGNSYENPIVVISPKDAQAMILRFQLKVHSKTLNGQNGRYYDVYLVENEEAKQYPIYFDITIPHTIGMKKLEEN
jgi:hypothetical protein